MSHDYDEKDVKIIAEKTNEIGGILHGIRTDLLFTILNVLIIHIFVGTSKEKNLEIARQELDNIKSNVLDALTNEEGWT